MNEGPFEVIWQDGNKISLYDYKHEQLVKDVDVGYFTKKRDKTHDRGGQRY